MKAAEVSTRLDEVILVYRVPSDLLVSIKDSLLHVIGRKPSDVLHELDKARSTEPSALGSEGILKHTSMEFVHLMEVLLRLCDLDLACSSY